MSSISDAKVLGGIGAILVLLAAVPNIGWLFGIAGFVMILLAIRNISQAVGDNKIYNNMLIAVVLGIGAIAVGTVTVVGAIVHVLGMGTFVGSRFVPPTHLVVGDWLGLAVAVIGGLLAVWALLVASAVFLRRTYSSMASKLNVKMFDTAGLLYLIGAATAIIGVGFIVILVAEILLAVSFFSIPEQPHIVQAQPVSNMS
jgi:uncharacterized membrane protein